MKKNQGIRSRLVVISFERDWSTNRLMEAIEDRVERLPLLLNPDSVSMTEEGLLWKGGKIDPEVAIVRRLKPSDLQSGMTASLFRTLKEGGCKVVNEFHAIATAANKAESSAILAKRGVPIPRFLVTRDFGEARDFVREEEKVVQKPLYGFRGKGLQIVTSREENKLKDQLESGDPIYLQSYVENPWDGRIFVAGEEPIAAIKRISGDDWRTNLARGGQVELWDPNQETVNMSIAAVNALELDYAAVDLIGDPKLVMEVNGTPGWRGLQRVAEVDVAERLVDIFLGEG